MYSGLIMYLCRLIIMYTQTTSFSYIGVITQHQLCYSLLVSVGFSFEETGSEWLLQTRPPGLLGCLQELVTYLGTQLTNEGSRKLFGRGGESKEDSHKPVLQLPVLTQVLLKIIWWDNGIINFVTISILLPFRFCYHFFPLSLSSSISLSLLLSFPLSLSPYHLPLSLSPSLSPPLSCAENLVAVSQTRLADTVTDICNSCLQVILVSEWM